MCFRIFASCHRGFTGGGGVFRHGKISGGVSFFRLVRKFSETFCAIRAICCSLGRQLTLFFCREVLVSVHCMSGSVFVLVQIPKNCSWHLVYPQKNDFVYPTSFFCESAVYPKDCGSRSGTQGTKIWGCRNFPTRKPPPLTAWGKAWAVARANGGSEHIKATARLPASRGHTCGCALGCSQRLLCFALCTGGRGIITVFTALALRGAVSATGHRPKRSARGRSSRGADWRRQDHVWEAPADSSACEGHPSAFPYPEA